MIKFKSKDILKKPRPIFVRWKDHYSVRDGWSDTKFFDGQYTSIENDTYGWLIAENNESLAVSLSYCPWNQSSSDSLCILKSTIVKRKFVTRVK